MGEIGELGAFGNLVVGVTTLGDVATGCAELARLSGRAKRLVDAGHIPATSVGAELVPAREPGLANGDGGSVVSC